MAFVNRDYNQQPRGATLPHLDTGAKIDEVVAARSGNTQYGDTRISSRIMPQRGDGWLNIMMGDRRRPAKAGYGADSGPGMIVHKYDDTVRRNILTGMSRRGQINLQRNIEHGLVDRAPSVISDPDNFDPHLVKARRAPNFLGYYKTGYKIVVPKGRGPKLDINAATDDGMYAPRPDPRLRMANSIQTRQAPRSINIRSTIRTIPNRGAARENMLSNITYRDGKLDSHVAMPSRPVVENGGMRPTVSRGSTMAPKMVRSTATNIAMPMRSSASSYNRVNGVTFTKPYKSYGGNESRTRVSAISPTVDPRTIRSNMTSFIPQSKFPNQQLSGVQARRASSVYTNSRLESRPFRGNGRVTKLQMPIGSTRVRSAKMISAETPRHTKDAFTARTGKLIIPSRDNRRIMGDLRDITRSRQTPATKQKFNVLRPNRRSEATIQVDPRFAPKPMDLRRFKSRAIPFTHVAHP